MIMSTLTKASGKVMLKSLDTYRVFFDQVTKCTDPTKPSLTKSHPKIREKLDTSFLNLSTDWCAYKRETGLSNKDFNKVDETTEAAAIEHNDAWFKSLQEEYYDLCERSDDVLEKQADEKANVKDTKVAEEEKTKVQQEKKVATLLSAQMESETEAIKAAVIKLEIEVSAVTAGTLEFTKAESLKAKVMNLSDRLNAGLQNLVMQCLSLLEEGEAGLKNNQYNQFMSQQRTRLAEITSQIVEKTKKKAEASALTVEKSKDQTFLKKIDPPKFDGDEITFPDFKRKWMANVSNSNLTPESELDRLRDNVPSQAAKTLFG